MKTLAISTIALVLGSGVGYAVADGEPDVKTETITKEVKVPSEPEVITETVTEEVEVEVYKTPEVCIRALDLAEDSAAISAEFANTSSNLPTLVGQAFEAGATNNLQLGEEVIDKLNGFTADFKDQSGRLGNIVRDYNSASDECRAAR